MLAIKRDTMSAQVGLAAIGLAILLAPTAHADMYAWSHGDEMLTAVDPTIPLSTDIGTGNDAGNPSIAEIEYHAGVIYAADTNTNNWLHLVDPSTGSIFDTLELAFPTDDPANVITSLEFVGGTLYAGLTREGGGATYLSVIDLESGDVTIIGMTVPNAPLGGLAHDGQMLYGVTAGGSAAELVTIDMGTGAATSIGTVSFEETPLKLTALEFDKDGTLYGFSHRRDSAMRGHLLSIDPATAAATDHGFTGDSSIVALTTPEPSSLVLVGVGAMLTVVRRA